MSLLNPGPQASLSGRTRRALSFLAHHNAVLKETFEWSDRVAVAMTTALILSWILRKDYPESMKTIAEGIHVVSAVLIGLYFLLRFLFRFARKYLPRGESPILTMTEEQIDWRKPCSADVTIVADPKKTPEEQGRHLDAAVKLCHESLGFEHDEFSISARRTLYERWSKANSKSILLIVPQSGTAKGEAIGVIIILPLTGEGLSFIQDRRGGVLKLDERHILSADRRSTQILLIDTLLLSDKWIPAYGPLAFKALFQHVAMFYNSKTWLGTEIYCCIFQGGTAGKFLPGMRRLIEKRGFAEFGRTTEGETLFRLCLRSLEADPLTRSKYNLYKSTLQACAESLVSSETNSA